MYQVCAAIKDRRKWRAGKTPEEMRNFQILPKNALYLGNYVHKTDQYEFPEDLESH